MISPLLNVASNRRARCPSSTPTGRKSCVNKSIASLGKSIASAANRLNKRDRLFDSAILAPRRVLRHLISPFYRLKCAVIRPLPLTLLRSAIPATLLKRSARTALPNCGSLGDLLFYPGGSETSISPRTESKDESSRQKRLYSTAKTGIRCFDCLLLGGYRSASGPEP